MDRVMLIDHDGKLYYIEPPDEVIKEIVDESGALSKRFIRISNSKWCFWTISSDFEVYLYVYDTIKPIQAIELTFENQKRFTNNKESKFRDFAEPDDIYSFSSEDGSMNLPKESFLLPSENWKWEGDWYTYEPNTQDGWKYSFSFKKKLKEKPSFYSLFRRRKWMRKRIFNSYNSFIQIDPPLAFEFINDITVGGWSIPNNKLKGFLSVWIISNNGRLFFRENVSYENPEGFWWKQIEIPESLKASSISCSPDGSLWVITCEGSILYRTGVNYLKPYGESWKILNPYPNTIFSEITCNLNLAYALDSKGSVYFLEDTYNKEWCKVLKDLSSISVSMSNKIWAVSADKKTIYIGSKIHSIESAADLPKSNSLNWKCLYSPILLDRIDAATACDQIEDLTNLKLDSSNEHPQQQ